MDNSACHECRSIAEEIAAAYADLWVSSDRRFQDARIATYKMIGGTAEDFTRAEEIPPFCLSVTWNSGAKDLIRCTDAGLDSATILCRTRDANAQRTVSPQF
jgi:hypothetical protein